MGLFDIFKQKEQGAGNQQYHSFLDMIELNLKNLPDDTFTLDGKEITESGKEITNFSKELSYKECSIFNIIKIIQHSEEDYNVILQSEDMNVDISLIEKLVNDLYSIYGDDEISLGRFTHYDRDAIQDGFWTGRMYCDLDKYVGKQKINLIGHGENIELIIFSPRLED